MDKSIKTRFDEALALRDKAAVAITEATKAVKDAKENLVSQQVTYQAAYKAAAALNTELMALPNVKTGMRGRPPGRKSAAASPTTEIAQKQAKKKAKK